ncbi:hypothetical protein ACVWW2_008276 [Bradyrhizobium sp. LM4.3]
MFTFQRFGCGFRNAPPVRRSGVVLTANPNYASSRPSGSRWHSLRWIVRARSCSMRMSLGQRRTPGSDDDRRGVQMTADRSEAAFEVGLFQIKVDEEAEDDRFYEALVPFDFFDDVVRRDRYRPLPDDWIIAVTDVSQSTEAIEQGRYREVNTAGAAVLAAVSNALPDLQFPSTFGGDGASFAAPAAYSSIIKDTLARTAAWAEDTLGLTLRIAVIPIADIRAQQLDVLVARFAPSSNVNLCDVRRRRTCLGRARTQARGLYRPARAHRSNSRPHRSFVPICADRYQARRHLVSYRRSAR